MVPLRKKRKVWCSKAQYYGAYGYLALTLRQWVCKNPGPMTVPSVTLRDQQCQLGHHKPKPYTLNPKSERVTLTA